MSSQEAYKLLGVSEGSIKGKPELEKVRQRSKELFKRYVAEKQEAKAKKVIEAFEVIKSRFKKAEAGGKDASNGHSKNSSTAKPDPQASSGSSAAKQKEAQIDKKLASIRQQFGDSASASKMTEAHKKASASSQERKPSSHSQSSSSQPQVVRVKSSGGSAGGTGSVVHKPGGILSLGVSKSGSSTSSTSGQKRPSSTDIPFGSKRSNVPAAAPAGGSQPDKQARLTCKCGASYGAVRFQGANGSFLCPGCRFRAMDPMNVVMKGSKGLLVLKLVQPPIVPEEAKQEATFQFKVDAADVKEWRKAGDNIECRMCKLDSYQPIQVWPNYLSFKVNGRQAFEIQEPKPGHKRRDLPQRISASIKPGLNRVEVFMKDPKVQTFALAVLRTTPQLPKDMCKQLAKSCVKTEDCKQKIMDLMFASSLDGCIEDFQAAVSDRSRLICPISLERIRTPARGKKCRHLQCFDLEAYLVSNQKMSSMKKRWLCPVCDLPIKPPGDLFIDTFHVQILAETGMMDEEVAFDSMGGWKVSAVADSPVEDSDNEGLPLTFGEPASSPKVQDDDGSGSDVAMVDEHVGNNHSDVEEVANSVDAAKCSESPPADAVDSSPAAGPASPAADESAAKQEVLDGACVTEQTNPKSSEQSEAKSADAPVEDAKPSDDVTMAAKDDIGLPGPSPVEADPGSPGEAESDAEPQCESDPYASCETDPYEAPVKDDDVDEDFVATLTSFQTEKVPTPVSSERNGRVPSRAERHAQKLLSLIATPAPLATPLASPPPVEDDDPLGLDKLSPKKKRV